MNYLILGLILSTGGCHAIIIRKHRVARDAAGIWLATTAIQLAAGNGGLLLRCILSEEARMTGAPRCALRHFEGKVGNHVQEWRGISHPVREFFGLWAFIPAALLAIRGKPWWRASAGAHERPGIRALDPPDS
jgi:hypothetical protein